LEHEVAEHNKIAMKHAKEHRRADDLAHQVRSLMEANSEIQREKKDLNITIDKVNLELERERRQTLDYENNRARQTAPPRFSAPTEQFFDQDLYERVGMSVKQKKKKRGFTSQASKRHFSDEDGIPSSS
jgi:hypothetical protein